MHYRTQQLDNGRVIVERSANGVYWAQMGFSYATEQEAQSAIESDRDWQAVYLGERTKNATRPHGLELHGVQQFARALAKLVTRKQAAELLNATLDADSDERLEDWDVHFVEAFFDTFVEVRRDARELAVGE